MSAPVADVKATTCMVQWHKDVYSVSQKIPPPLRFSDIFPKQMGIFDQFLHT